MANGKLQWNFAADDIHMAYLYSRLCHMTVRATVGYYMTQHPEAATHSITAICNAFKNGLDDQGLLDSHLPDLTTFMTQIPHSREKWYAERLGIEAISRDLGSANVFLTINLDVRSSKDVRELIYRLETGQQQMPENHPFEKNTEVFTQLLNKYAVHVSLYLYRKVKIILRAFLSDICGVAENETDDWLNKDKTETSWNWQRVEFTETRGVQHWHCLVKLPHVLDTALLGRIIHNSRVIRQEMKCANINPAVKEQAWKMIEMGLLASRYVTLFADSISTASFYSEHVDIDGHDDTKVVNLEEHRQEYWRQYNAGNITTATNPIMRQFNDAQCDSNVSIEMAKVASVCGIHACIPERCGGAKDTREGCRFSFPKKLLKQTVPAVMSVNARSMETRVLLRRTCDRVANLNRYLLRYLRSNHSVDVLIDSAHSCRYATKYAAKSGKYTELLDEVIENVSKRSQDLMPPNTKQVLSQLILADCSHRAFMSKQELAYKVLNLPEVRRSFTDVSVVGFYP